MKPHAALTLCTVLVSPVATHAADFTITVPIEASGLPPSINLMSVDCRIMAEDTSKPANEIARGGVGLTITTSRPGVHFPAVVTINASPGKDPSLARWYKCWSSFQNDDGRTYFLNGQRSGLVFPLADGAPFYLGNYDRWIRIPGR